MVEGSNESRPPYGNTGVVHTSSNPLRACVDWVEATLKTENLQIAFDLLNMKETDFILMDRGAMGYRRQLRAGNIIILADGNEGMGIHIVMSGQGCRQFEASYPYTWSKFFNDIFKKGEGHFTRLDAAIDDFKGYFTIRQIRGKVRRGECSSKFRGMKSIEKFLIKDGSTKGATCYFGSDKSDIKVRFYDKLQERKAQGLEIEEGLTVWNRTEIEMRDEKADAFAILLINSYINHLGQEKKRIGQIIAGALKNYITFRKKNGDSNKSRWDVCEWWIEFLGDVEKISLSEQAPDRTLEQTKKWFEKQTPRTMAKLYLALGSDMNYLENLIRSGITKLSEFDIQQVDSYLKRFKEEGAEDDEDQSEYD